MDVRTGSGMLWARLKGDRRVRLPSPGGRRGDWPTVARANEILTASLAPPSIRTASREMGEQLLALASTWVWRPAGVAAL